jgi:hypothetical protein
MPSSMPSLSPSSNPSASPSDKPSVVPSSMPSLEPSQYPSILPSAVPSTFPSILPSLLPSVSPSATPSGRPSLVPTDQPSTMPSVCNDITGKTYYLVAISFFCMKVEFFNGGYVNINDQYSDCNAANPKPFDKLSKYSYHTTQMAYFVSSINAEYKGTFAIIEDSTLQEPQLNVVKITDDQVAIPYFEAILRLPACASNAPSVTPP